MPNRARYAGAIGLSALTGPRSPARVEAGSPLSGGSGVYHREVSPITRITRQELGCNPLTPPAPSARGDGLRTGRTLVRRPDTTAAALGGPSSGVPASTHHPHRHHAQQAGPISGSTWGVRVAGCPQSHTMTPAAGKRRPQWNTITTPARDGSPTFATRTPEPAPAPQNPHPRPRTRTRTPEPAPAPQNPHPHPHPRTRTAPQNPCPHHTPPTPGVARPAVRPAPAERRRAPVHPVRR